MDTELRGGILTAETYNAYFVDIRRGDLHSIAVSFVVEAE